MKPARCHTDLKCACFMFTLLLIYFCITDTVAAQSKHFFNDIA